MHRRTFTKTLSLALGAACAQALPLPPTPARRLKIGYTCITWGALPRGPEASATLEEALKDIAALGFHGFETFPEILEDWEARNALDALLERYEVPLVAGYVRVNLSEASVRKDEIAKAVRL